MCRCQWNVHGNHLGMMCGDSAEKMCANSAKKTRNSLYFLQTHNSSAKLTGNDLRKVHGSDRKKSYRVQGGSKTCLLQVILTPKKRVFLKKMVNLVYVIVFLTIRIFHLCDHEKKTWFFWNLATYIIYIHPFLEIVKTLYYSKKTATFRIFL